MFWVTFGSDDINSSVILVLCSATERKPQRLLLMRRSVIHKETLEHKLQSSSNTNKPFCCPWSKDPCTCQVMITLLMKKPNVLQAQKHCTVRQTLRISSTQTQLSPVWWLWNNQCCLRVGLAVEEAFCCSVWLLSIGCDRDVVVSHGEKAQGKQKQQTSNKYIKWNIYST